MAIRFNGKDQFDLDQQIWAWRSGNPRLRVTKVHPTEELPLSVSSPYPMRKILPKDRLSVLVEYEESPNDH